MNLRIITNNHAADPKRGSLLKSILEPIGLTSPSRQPGSYVKNALEFVFVEFDLTYKVFWMTIFHLFYIYVPTLLP